MFNDFTEDSTIDTINVLHNALSLAARIHEVTGKPISEVVVQISDFLQTSTSYPELIFNMGVTLENFGEDGDTGFGCNGCTASDVPGFEEENRLVELFARAGNLLSNTDEEASSDADCGLMSDLLQKYDSDYNLGTVRGIYNKLKEAGLLHTHFWEENDHKIAPELFEHIKDIKANGTIIWKSSVIGFLVSLGFSRS